MTQEDIEKIQESLRKEVANGRYFTTGERARGCRAKNKSMKSKKLGEQRKKDRPA